MKKYMKGEWRKDWKTLIASLKKRAFLGIDFDGVIAKTTVSGATKDGIDGELVVDPATGLTSLDFLRDAVKYFWVVICTTRCCAPDAAELIAAWLLERGLEREVLRQITITDQKPPGIILDDRGWQFNGKFPAMKDLLAFIPWHGKGIVDGEE